MSFTIPWLVTAVYCSDVGVALLGRGNGVDVVDIYSGR